MIFDLCNVSHGYGVSDYHKNSPIHLKTFSYLQLDEKLFKIMKKFKSRQTKLNKKVLPGGLNLLVAKIAVVKLK